MANPNSTCSEHECAKKLYARGLCSKHYQKWRTYGDPSYRHPKFTKRKCDVSWCEADAICRGWCHSHYDKWNVHGDPLFRAPGEIRDGKRICSSCGVDTPLDDMRRTLCAPCMSARSRTYYSYVPNLVDKVCEVCRAEYKGNPKKSKYCSDGCREAGLTAAKAVRDRRIKQTSIERFSKYEIFDRDGWVCHLCGDGIPRVAKYPHPLSASLDHVLPVARGGEHTRENTAASHFQCNLRKGASITA